MKKPKQYPMNGPSIRLQRIRLKANPTADDRMEMRQYARKLRENNGRTETAEAYER